MLIITILVAPFDDFDHSSSVRSLDFVIEAYQDLVFKPTLNHLHEQFYMNVDYGYQNNHDYGLNYGWSFEGF